MFSRVTTQVLMTAFGLCVASGGLAAYSMVTGWKPEPRVIDFGKPSPDTVAASLDLQGDDALHAEQAAPVSIKAAIVSSKQLRCLQENIYFESRNQSVLGNAMVGMVTLERAKLSKNPEDICAVVFKPKQFSWANNGRIKPKLNNDAEKRAWAIAGMLAEALLKYDQKELDIVFNKVTHYHTTAVSPKWSRSNELQAVMTVGDHIFYQEGNG